MFVVEGARKKIVKKRQSSFFEETLPQIIMEAYRLEISEEEIIQFIAKFKGAK